jgi:hypothetical protein
MAAQPKLVPVHHPKARLLRTGDPLPATLMSGFPFIDPSWTWVIDGLTGIEAVLIAAPGPGVAILVRICSLPSASSTAYVKLLRKALTDINSRGYSSYMVCLDTNRPSEAKLARIAIKAGGLVIAKASLIAGKTDIGRL